MAGPSLNVVQTELDGEAAEAVRTEDLVGEYPNLEGLVLGRQRVSEPQVLFAGLDETEQGLGLREVLGFHTLNGNVTFNPGDGPQPRATEGVSPTDAVSDVELSTIDLGDREPPAFVVFDALGPAPREGADRGRAHEP